MVQDFSIDADWNSLYIDGEWIPSEGDTEIPVENPSTREVVVQVSAAYEAAANAQKEWQKAPPAECERVAREFAQRIQEYKDEIIELLAYEAGGSQIMGETSVRVATDQASEAATFPRRMKGEQAASNILGKENFVGLEPESVVTVISPWNFPLNLSGRAIAPAIATGNTVVVKPASNTPITGGLLIRS